MRLLGLGVSLTRLVALVVISFLALGLSGVDWLAIWIARLRWFGILGLEDLVDLNQLVLLFCLPGLLLSVDLLELLLAETIELIGNAVQEGLVSLVFIHKEELDWEVLPFLNLEAHIRNQLSAEINI